MDKTELATFYSDLATIINVSPDLAVSLIKGFNTDDISFFQPYFDALPTVSFSRNGQPNTTVNNTLYIKDVFAGKGAYGLLEHNRNNPFVYKIINDTSSPLPDERLNYLKNIYKEVIILTLLQNDSLYGRNVSRIYKLYRSGNTCIVKMETLEITLKNFIQIYNDSKALTVKDKTSIMQNILIKIIEILTHFRTKYEFHHYDLHTSNIMTTKTGDIINNIKIIDFGLSYVKIDGVEIGILGKGFNDCYNLSFYLLFQASSVSKKLRDLLEKFTDYPDETPPGQFLEELKSANVTNNTGGKRKTRRRGRK